MFCEAIRLGRSTLTVVQFGPVEGQSAEVMQGEMHVPDNDGGIATQKPELHCEGSLQAVPAGCVPAGGRQTNTISSEEKIAYGEHTVPAAQSASRRHPIRQAPSVTTVEVAPLPFENKYSSQNACGPSAVQSASPVPPI